MREVIVTIFFGFFLAQISHTDEIERDRTSRLVDLSSIGRHRNVFAPRFGNEISYIFTRLPNPWLSVHNSGRLSVHKPQILVYGYRTEPTLEKEEFPHFVWQATVGEQNFIGTSNYFFRFEDDEVYF